MLRQITFDAFQNTGYSKVSQVVWATAVFAAETDVKCLGQAIATADRNSEKVHSNPVCGQDTARCLLWGNYRALSVFMSAKKNIGNRSATCQHASHLAMLCSFGWEVTGLTRKQRKKQSLVDRGRQKKKTAWLRIQKRGLVSNNQPNGLKTDPLARTCQVTRFPS